MSEKVAILGCGPAGLIAAHTARRLGHRTSVYSKKVKSTINGAQVVHQPIIGMHDPDEPSTVHYIKNGNEEGYAEKVYGKVDAPTSWPLYEEGPMDYWPMRTTYETLWAQWEPSIFDVDLDYGTARRLADEHDHVFSTVPLPVLLKKPEWEIFTHQPVWISQEFLAFNPSPSTHAEGSWIEYNGLPSSQYYRKSWINGWLSIECSEYSTLTNNTTMNWQRISKPLDVWGGDATRAEITPLGVTLVGRYGEWRKGRLTHHAQEVVEEVLG